MEIDEKQLIESYQIYVNEIQKKEWYELTTDEMALINDPKKRGEYQKLVCQCLRSLINPLYDSIKNRGRFKFSVSDKLLTCEIMVRELMNYYKKQGFTKEEIINIACEADSSKKY